jgi:hypothetical protein
MKSLQERRAELQARNRVQRDRRKRAAAPVTVQTIIDNITVVLPLAQAYIPLFTLADDTKLLDIAQKYEIALTQEERTLVEQGDTFLPQYDKVELTEDEEVELILDDWSPLVSSNLKAVKIRGNDLLIWFHSNSQYLYPNQSELYNAFNEALSPGRLLWRTIRKVKGYRRIV